MTIYYYYYYHLVIFLKISNFPGFYKGNSEFFSDFHDSDHGFVRAIWGFLALSFRLGS